MKTLIIDTTKSNMFVGLKIDDNEYVAKVSGFGKHNETLLPTIDNLLTENNTTLSQIDVVALNIGAGSFTGIRVGVSTVKAFCVALPNLKCVAFTSFELLAYSSSEQNEYEAVISAGADNMYVAKCNGKNVISQQHNTFAEFNETKHNKIVANIEEENVLPISNLTYIKELKYFNLVAEKISNNEFSNANNLEPLYLRLSQAERELQAKNANTSTN